MKNMRRSLIALAASSAMAVPFVAHAGDPAAGEGKYASCAACHGADGGGHGGAFPALQGKTKDSVVSSMTAYRDGDQDYLASVGLGDRYGTMAPNAAGLSDEDIADLAAYIAQEFGGMGAEDDAADSVPSAEIQERIITADLERGEALYSSCAICHGWEGEGGAMFNAPKLTGLGASSVASLLGVYRQGTEMGPNSYSMIPQAIHLSDADIANLAAYIGTMDDDDFGASEASR